LALDDSDDFYESLLSWSAGAFDDPLFDLQSSSLRPLSRIEVNDEFVIVTFDMPGVRRDDISVSCTADMVSVEAQMTKPYRTSTDGGRGSAVEFVKYSKKVALPVLVDPENGVANFRNGIIVVKLPRLYKGKPVRISS
jgi:HSP20 family protein